MLFKINDAERFLSRLRTTENDTNYLFCCYPDPPDLKGNTSIPGGVYGNIRQYEDKLIRYNESLYGVYVTVNKTESKSRKKDDIVLARAIWQEDDGDGKEIKLPPSFTVETSPNKYHRYWIIDGGTTDFERWQMIMDVMVNQYGSDPNAKDLCRVMRLPGFNHVKDPSNPFLVHILNGTGPSYRFDDLCQFFIPEYMKQRAKASYSSANSKPRGGEDKEPEYTKDDAIQAIITGTNFHNCLCSLSMRMINSGLSRDDCLLVLEGLMYKAKPQCDHDRWQARFNELPRLVDSGIDKYNEENEDDHPALHRVTSISPYSKEADYDRKYTRLPMPPGIMGDIANNIMEFMRYPAQSTAIMTAFHLVNVFGCVYAFEDVPLSRRDILLSDLGRGKNTPLRYISALISAIGRKYTYLNDIDKFMGSGSHTSPAILHNELQEFGSRSIITSEAGHVVTKQMGDIGGLKAYLNQALMSPPGSMLIPRAQKVHDKQRRLAPIYTYTLSIIHESVPENYVETLQDQSSFIDGTSSRDRFIFEEELTRDTGINRSTTEVKIPDNIIDFFASIIGAYYNTDPWNINAKKRGYIQIHPAPKVDDLFYERERAYMEEFIDSDSEVYRACLIRRSLKEKQTARLLAIADNVGNANAGNVDKILTLDHCRYAEEYETAILDSLMYNCTVGIMTSALDQLGRDLVNWSRKYLKGELAYKPTSREVRDNVVNGNVCGQRFFGGNAKRRLLAKVKQFPEYRQCTAARLQIAVLEHVEKVQRTIRISRGKDMYGRAYAGNRVLFDYKVV